MAIFYLPGIVISGFLFREFLQTQYELIIILFVSCFFTLIGWNIKKSKSNAILKYKDVRMVALICLVIYLACMLFIYTKNPIALFNLNDPLVISEYRELATKGKTGLDGVINVIYYSTSYVALPLVVLQLYEKKYKFRHIILILLILSLMFTMEKARAFIIFVPLIVYQINKKQIKKVMLIVFIFGLLMFSAAKLVGLTSENLNAENYDSNLHQRAVLDPSKMLFETPDTIDFLINRIIWIPYITAIDWLKYNDEVLKGVLLYGSTTQFIGEFIGAAGRYRIENEIYKFQFSAPDESLGSSNSHFALDGYVNFSWLGVVVYSFVFGYLLKFLWTIYPDPYRFALYNYAFAATVANLHSLMFGGGLLLLILLIILLNYKNKYVKQKSI